MNPVLKYPKSAQIKNERRYKTVWYYSSEDEAYVMFAPDLPGCFADGKTMEEAKKNIKETISEKNAQGRDSPFDSEKRFINDVLSVYEPETPKWLSKLARSESPWRETRNVFLAARLSSLIIPPSLIEKYYAID